MAEKESKPDRAKESLGSKKSKKSKKKGVHSMHIHRTDNDHFIARHSFQSQLGEAPEPDQEHALASPEELASHVQEHFSQPAQEPAPAGPMPGMM